MSIHVNGRKLTWKLSSIKKLIFLRTERLPDDRFSNFLVEFRFKEFSQTLCLPSSIADISAPMSSCPLTISTLQKNNPPIWITDWLKWHHRTHGVQRLVLYDNGSSNRDDLVDSLKRLRLNVHVVFVDWNFPYGIRPRLFCQLGSLNHCRVRFPILGGYCINNDIDEYIFCSEKSLIDYLQRKLRYPAPGAVIYESVAVPNITSSKRKSIRVSDFEFTRIKMGYENPKLPPKHFQTPKYIYSFGDIGYNGVHTTDSIKNRSFARRYSFASIMIFLIRKVIREGYNAIPLNAGYKYTRPRIDAVYVPESELCFLHFYGLNTGWAFHGDLPRSTFNPSIHKPDERIKQIVDCIDAEKDQV